jgi:hypothetical protein
LRNITSEGKEIKQRFDNMIVNLPETYAVLRLPQVLTTAAILAKV